MSWSFISNVTPCVGLQEEGPVHHVHYMVVSHSQHRIDGMLNSIQPITRLKRVATAWRLVEYLPIYPTGYCGLYGKYSTYKESLS